MKTITKHRPDDQKYSEKEDTGISRYGKFETVDNEGVLADKQCVSSWYPIIDFSSHPKARRKKTF